MKQNQQSSRQPESDSLSDLRVVHDLTELLAGRLDLQKILNITVEKVVEAMNVKACAIRLLNEETGELVIKAVCNLSEDYLKKGPVMLKGNAIDAEAYAGKTVYIEDAPNDPRTLYPENARREGIVSGLSIPMAFRGQSVGVLRIYSDKKRRFRESEEMLLRSIGLQAASAIINSNLFEQRAAAEKFQRQVDIAGEIQRRMLPDEPPPHSGLEFGCVYDPTLQVGGDFYDFLELSNNQLGLCVADVVGKGLPAALMMASVRSALRAFAHYGHDLEEVMTQTNRHMCRDTLVSEFATIIFGVFAADGKSFTYCNAGHLPVIRLRNEKFTEHMTGGMVIGVLEQAKYEVEIITIESGDILVFVTDGVTEAMDFQGVQYGWDRLLESIQKHQALEAKTLAQQILWDVRRFVGLAEQSDDITIVAVKMA